MCKCRADSHLQGSTVFCCFVTASRPRCPCFEKHWNLLLNSVYFSIYTKHLWGPGFICFKSPFPTFSGKELAWQSRRHRRCGFNTWVGKIPWRRKWQPTPAFLSGKSHGQRNLAGHSPWGCKSRTWLSGETNSQHLLWSEHSSRWVILII